MALIRRASVDVLEAALACVDAGLAVSLPADLMLHLAMRLNALAALVAQRHGPSLVGRLIATGPTTRAADDTELANLSTLIHAVVFHLSPAAFDEELAASAVATATAPRDCSCCASSSTSSRCRARPAPCRASSAQRVANVP